MDAKLREVRRRYEEINLETDRVVWVTELLRSGSLMTPPFEIRGPVNQQTGTQLGFGGYPKWYIVAKFENSLSGGPVTACVIHCGKTRPGHYSDMRDPKRLKALDQLGVTDNYRGRRWYQPSFGGWRFNTEAQRYCEKQGLDEADFLIPKYGSSDYRDIPL